MTKRVLVREAGKQRIVVVEWSSATVSLAVGWVGVVLAVAALADYALALFPTHFSSMEWEFGTIGQIFAGLPLLSIGLAAIWISGAMAGRRWMLLAIGVALWLAAVILVILLVAFALDIPVALKMNPGPAHEPVVKMVLKTVILGLLFGTSYVCTGVLALKQARGTPAGEVGT